MPKKNTPPSKNSINNNPSSTSKRKSLSAAIMMTAGVLSTNLAYNQTPNTSLVKDSKNTTTELVEKNDSIEHQRIMNMNVDSLLMEYGQEKGMEMIREHMLIEINKVRTAQGKQALVQNDTLNRIAQEHSQYMYENNRYSHSDKEGHNANRRIENAGKNFGKNRIVKGGENIAKNYHTVGSVLDGWLNHSAGHRANILFVDRKEIGIGYNNGYWTQDFY